MPLHIACRADDGDKHENDVNQILFHNGKLYSAGDDGKVKVWAPDLKLLQSIQAHPCSVFSLAASNDTLYTCSNEGTVKSWDLATLKEKKVLLEDKDCEFWKVKYDNGVLYVGDDQGNVKIYKNEVFYGSINVAIPVKDLVVKDNLLFTAKDIDVIVSDLHLGGDIPQFGIKATLAGRGPVVIIDDKAIFCSREGKDILLNVIAEKQHIKEVSKISGAHDMIINGAAAANWDGNSVLFTGGWNKEVKQWKIEKDSLKLEGSVNTEFVVNAITIGDKGQAYGAGGDGHIVRFDL